MMRNSLLTLLSLLLVSNAFAKPVAGYKEFAFGTTVEKVKSLANCSDWKEVTLNQEVFPKPFEAFLCDDGIKIGGVPVLARFLFHKNRLLEVMLAGVPDSTLWSLKSKYKDFEGVNQADINAYNNGLRETLVAKFASGSIEFVVRKELNLLTYASPKLAGERSKAAAAQNKDDI